MRTPIWSHFTLITSVKALSPNTVTFCGILEVRPLTYEFSGDTIQPLAIQVVYALPVVYERAQHTQDAQLMWIPLTVSSGCSMRVQLLMTSTLKRCSPLRLPMGKWLGGNIMNIGDLIVLTKNLIPLILFRRLNLNQTHDFSDSLPDNNN